MIARSSILPAVATRFSLVLLLAAGLLAGRPCPAAEPTDAARFMPAETTLYLGWGPTAPRPECAGQARRIVEGLLNMDSASDERQKALARQFAELVESLPACAGGIGLFDVQIKEGRPDIEAALVATGLAAADLHTRVTALQAEMHPDSKPEPRKVRSAELLAWQPHADGPVLLWGRHKDCFLLALGEPAATRVLATLDGGPSLADAAELVLCRRKLDVKAEGPYFCIYADVARMVARGKALATEALGTLPPEVDPLLTELGLTALRSKYVHFAQGRMGAFAHVDGPLKGLLKPWDQSPLSENDLRIVPKSAHWAHVTNLDLRGLWEEIVRVLEEVRPDVAGMVQGGVAMTAPVLGFSITEDLLPAFGDTWAIFDAPEHGGLLITGAVLAVDTTDAEKLQNMLARSIEVLRGLVAQSGEKTLRLTLKQTTYGSHTIHYLFLAGIPAPVAPAWGFVDNRWVFGLNPQTVAVALRQVDPATRKDSVLDRPDVQAARKALPPEPQSFTYVDSQGLARAFYPLANGVRIALASLAGSESGIDLKLAPPITEATVDVRNLVLVGRRDTDGILYAGVGSFGAAAAVPGVAAALAAGVALPALGQARGKAVQVQEMQQLKQIAMATIMYAVDHDGVCPPSLDALVAANLLKPEMLVPPHAPADQSGFVYLAAGQKMEMVTDPARKPLAYARTMKGDATAVAFMDGHVEWVDAEAFQKLVPETPE